MTAQRCLNIAVTMSVVSGTWAILTFVERVAGAPVASLVAALVLAGAAYGLGRIGG